MLNSVLVSLLAVGTALAAPALEKLEQRQDQTACTKPMIRKAWHTLTKSEKKAYLDAEICLMTKPASMGLSPAAKTRFDEFQLIHMYQAPIAHNVAQFFPFHRLYVWAHEHILRTECGYTGTQPYWAEEVDAGAFSKSTVLDGSEYSFGGNGDFTTGCISTGPFANYTNRFGPGYLVADHCISRNISDYMSQNAKPSILAFCQTNSTEYESFWHCIENTPHGAGHGGVGLEMLNPISSPGDPTFYLHHAWIDRLWAKWQAADPSVRHKQISGNNKRLSGFAGFSFGPQVPGAVGFGFPGAGGVIPTLPLDGSALADPFAVPDGWPHPTVVGDPGNETTLDHLVQVYGVVPNRTVAELMDTKGAVLCYDYDDTLVPYV